MTLKNGMKRCWEHKRLAAVLVLWGVMAAAVPAQASSLDPEKIIHNEQQLDLFTGEPVVNTKEKPEIRLNQYCTYDKAEQRYVYQYGEDVRKIVYADVADGMYTNGTVTVTWSEPMACRVYRNGLEVAYRSGDVLSEPGFYQTLITDSESAEEYSIAFGIISKYTNAANYRIPDGFQVETLMYEGRVRQQEDRLISLREEGTYHIVLRTQEGDVRSAVDMTVDHTPPTLLLQEVDEEGFAYSAVDVSDVEPGARIYATIDGTECTVGRRLTQPGFYRLSVEDEAGNSTEYSFTIRMYFTVSSVAAILLMIAVVGALAAYIAISRWRITVR